jgi:hypothetical protein
MKQIIKMKLDKIIIKNLETIYNHSSNSQKYK